MKLKQATVERKALKLFLTLLLLCALVWILAIMADAGTYDISSADEFIAYADAYNAGERDPGDTLRIAISSGDVISDANFTGLGTLSQPFAGTIEVPTAGIDTFDLYDCPLFNYVTTDLKIIGSGVVKIRRVLADGSGGALFANHVIAGSDAANWNIVLASDSSNSASFAGVFGDIAAGATVTVSFTNNASIPVAGTGNLGYICGTLGAGATLNVTTAGSGSNVSLSTTGGHAGGLVGEMGNGATLQFNSDNNTHVNAVTTTGADKYAGGIVGYADRVNILWKAGVTDYTVSGSVSGTAGAGGLFGYYKNANSSVNFTMAGTYAITSGMTIKSDAYTGGVFGMLENNGASFVFNGNRSGSEAIRVTFASGTARGGVCGAYKASALTNTFELTNISSTIRSNTATAAENKAANYSAGLVGSVVTNAAYVYIHDVACASTGTSSGNAPDAGLVGTIGSTGSFIDVAGTVTVTGRFHSGLICNMQDGVLRMQGMTDLSAYQQWNDTTNLTSGTIVKDRGRALIYALGSGSDYEDDGEGHVSGWTLKRNVAAAPSIDDVMTWGQVLRVNGTKLAENDLFTVNMTAHTVTIAAPVTDMGDITAFVKTALNIQLGNSAAKGAMQFASPNQSTTLLAASLSITDDIDLSGTGILGLTRDNGSNAAFSGTFDGKGHTLTFATGEVYGTNASGTALQDSDMLGVIRRHVYHGLFAKSNNATFKNIKLAGTIKVLQDVDNNCLGGLVAEASGSLTLTDVTVTALTFNFRVNANYQAFIGGAVGCATGNSLTVTVSQTAADLSIFKPIIADYTPSGKARGKMTYVGGIIGYIGAGSTQRVTVTDIKTGVDYTKTIDTTRESCFGGVIGGMANQAYAKDKRQVTLTGVHVNMNATGTAGGSRFGGILGTDWYAADVTISGLVVDSAVISATGTANFGGLVYAATGRWDVQSLLLTNVSFTLTKAGSTFGFIANKTFCSTDASTALYLDVNNTDSNYDITALTFTTSGTFAMFDEIVADSRFNGADIDNSGNSVISITTSGNVILTAGDTYNTYQNKTTYGQANHSINPNTRYYYNVADARANTGTDKYKFFVFTVGQYAHSTLSAWFAVANTAFTGTLDMTGISYYPIDLKSNISFTNATIKLDNALMETRVDYTDGTTQTRTTRSNTNQHYLMHTAVFRNATANITITKGTTGLTLQGNVPKMSDSFCGFFVAGTLGGKASGDPTVFTAADLLFDGVHITTNGGGDLSDTTYAPLFINKIGRNINFTINGAAQSTTAYSGYTAKYAGSSLIGDVGNSTARAITLTFTGLVFDGSDASVSLGTYGTTRAIFSRATLLNSFIYAGECTGSYNFTDTEDWPTSIATHKVTYGREITTSVENSGKQKKYNGSAYYVHPANYQETGSEYDFSTHFLPYVYLSYSLVNFRHELAVNVSYSSEIEGCGKYDDPFVIDGDSKLAIISLIIRGDNVGSTVTLDLPSDIGNFDYTTRGYTKYNYAFDTSSLISSNGGDPVSNSDLRRYLAGAYYKVGKASGAITLPTDYVSLGYFSTDNPEYAFRGVLIGTGTGRIVNTSPNPLIKSSNGCVVKDLTIEVNTESTIALGAPSAGDLYAYSGGIQAYGAVIAQIMGGDTIFDSVHVIFTGAAFTFSNLNPIGGYVGVIVNGGLIFRNMTTTNSALPASKCSQVESNAYLYVNPVIGRVIAGYAFNEADAYSATSATIPNGNKDYTIPDLSTTGGKLNITNSSSKFTVQVPDGQALFVLGAIINSGAASATYNSSTEQPYITFASSPALNSDVFWQAYRAHTATRAGSGYSTVGSTDGTDNDFKAAVNDTYSDGLTKVPYIIRAYSNKTSNVYFARALATTGRSNTVLSFTGDCSVAAGFRGIGSPYMDASGLYLPVSSVLGGDHTITLNMRYLEYSGTTDAYRAVSNTSAATGESVTSYCNAGFGLFNRLRFTGNGSGDNVIKNFTLAGTVYYDILNISNGSSLSYTWSNLNKNYARNVGGLAGVVYNSSNCLKINGVIMDGLTVVGAKHAGGLIGLLFDSASSNVYHHFNQCTTTANGVNVTAGLAAGGFIGHLVLGSNAGSYNKYLIIEGASAGSKTELKNVTVTTKGSMGSSVERVTTSAGAMIGSADLAYSSAKDTLTIRYMKVTGAVLSCVQNDAYSAAGGLVGKVRGLSLKFNDNTIETLNINNTAGNYPAFAGGVIGHVVIPRNTARFAINNILVDGQSTATIAANQYAGGLIGHLYLKNQTTADFSANTVKNCTVNSAGTAGAAGGFIGLVNSVDSSGAHTYSLNNSEVNGCTVNAAYTSAGSGDAKGVGGLFGAISGHGSKTDVFNAYNVMIQSTLTGSGTTNFGAIVGNNVTSKKAAIKFVGVSVAITTAKTLGSGERNNNGYAVFADYAATKTNETFAGIDDAGTGDDYYNDVTAANPYATTNPALALSGMTITGDGIAATVNSLPIQTILTDGTGGKYAYAAAYWYTGSSGDTNLAVFNAHSSKLAMFSTEATGYTGTDFPVLVLENVNDETATKIINSYLRLLTNTRYDFKTNLTNVFDVVIYNAEATNNTFAVSATGASLKRNAANGFYIINADYDSGKAQFSLIDVRFYDPAGTGNIAYHLYVPVFVKKVLSYQFDISALNGTAYLEDNYTSIYGRQLIENIGTPVTLYFKYTYSRTVTEWADAINAGELVKRSYVKKLLLNKSNNNDVLKYLPDDTILVLIDRQTNTPYYARLGDAGVLTGTDKNTLNLNMFRSVMTDSAGTLTFSGDTFAPVALQDLMSITVHPDDTNGTLAKCAANDPNLVLTVDGQGYRLATDETEKFYVTVESVQAESYYLSVFTTMTENYSNFHHFIITAPSAFDELTYPSKITDTDAHTMVHLLMGKIFSHVWREASAVTSTSSNGTELMTASNRSLTVNMTVKLSLSDDLGEVIKSDMKNQIRRAEVYQSFLVYLDRKEANTSSKVIIGNPTSTTHYYNVDDTLNGEADTATSAYTVVRMTQNHAEFVTDNLNTQFATGGWFEINATVTIDYEASAIPTQFPGRNDYFPLNGVTVSASSNIAFGQSATTYSKNSIHTEDSNGNRYYSEAQPEAATLALNPPGDKSGDFTPLGINPLELDGRTSATFTLVPVLDITPVISQTTDYDEAVVTVTLTRKQADGTYSAELTPINTYITAVTVGDVAAVAEGTTYTAVIAKSGLDDRGFEIGVPEITCTVKTGSAFEAAGLTYGNYRVTVTVALKRSGAEIGPSRASNYVIYTNAKILPYYVD